MERLQKYIARCGITSRRKAEKMIINGLVKVNGKIVTELGFKVAPGKDLVEIKNRKISTPDAYVYYLLNKPRQVVTTLSDPRGRRKIIDLLPEVKERIYPVGRLDYNSEGLLLLTNDGQLTNRLTHPRYGITKTYLVLVEGQVNKNTIRKLAKGILLEDGPTYPAKVKLLEVRPQTTLLKITISEGRNRQIRRMCKHVDHPVISLKRICFGPLELGDLKSGAYRKLNNEEIKDLKKVCGIK